MISLKDRLLKLKRQDRQAISNRVLPLIAFYGQSDKQEAVRAQFYTDMAKSFGWPTRYLDPHLAPGSVDKGETLVEPGMGGRGIDLVAINPDVGLFMNINAAPLEWLMVNGRLASKKDKPGMAGVRLQTGVRVRELFIGAEPTGLRSVDFGGAGGGGGSGPMVVADFKIDCMAQIDHIRKSLPPSTFQVLERIVYRDMWLWEKKTAARAAVVIDKLHRGLDAAALWFGTITRQEYQSRWERASSKPDPSSPGQPRPRPSQQA